jgi:glycerol-3-phosphate acyltransferase PlsY
MMIAKFAAVLVMGYLIGSIPIGYLLARRRANVDVTAYGSGKTGMTNVLRTAGRKSAALVGTLDLFKGVVAAITGRYSSDLKAAVVWPPSSAGWLPSVR